MEGIRNERRGFMSFDPQTGFSDLGGWVSVLLSLSKQTPLYNVIFFAFVR